MYCGRIDTITFLSIKSEMPLCSFPLRVNEIRHSLTDKSKSHGGPLGGVIASAVAFHALSPDSVFDFQPVKNAVKFKTYYRSRVFIV